MYERIHKIIAGEEVITIDELIELRKKYPYFAIPSICALRDKVELDSSQKEDIIGSLALNLSDRTILSSLIDDEVAQYIDFYPKEESKEVSTTDAIDTFLNTYGKADNREVDALTKIIFNPMPDYASVLASEGTSVSTERGTDSDSQDAKIDRFLDRHNIVETPKQEETSNEIEESKSDKLTNTGENTVSAPQTGENASLTESFAKVMIKNRNYSKALEIISELSLNNPEKSIYFADQIRFLQKLIINENKQ